MDKRVIIGVVATCVLLLGAGMFLARGNKTTTTSSTNSDLLKVNDKDLVKGHFDAEVTIIEYADFQCPSCGAYYPILKQLISDYPEQLRVVYRQFPLTSIHANAWSAATFAQASADQNKFWEIYDLLYANQKLWSEAKNPEDEFAKYAKTAGVDWEKAKVAMYSSDVVNSVQNSLKVGEDLGVNGTPTFFVNGEKITLPGGLDQFKKIVDGEIAKKQTSDKVHVHFDIAIYVDGKKVDLSENKYMEKNEAIHFHDNNGEVAHIHKKNSTLGDLLTSLEISTKEPHRLMVNGKDVTTDWKSYTPEDLDQIVLMFENTSVKTVVTDKACIYSETCPERGKPPTEKCVGGVGTDCVDKNE